MDINKGKIIGIISLKGGVGKTSSVANLGAALASEFGKKVGGTKDNNAFKKTNANNQISQIDD